MLETYGWHLLGADDHPEASASPFALEDDTVKWAVTRGRGPDVVELEFRAFGHFGERTSKLRDIMYCVALGSEHKLFFRKRNDPDWRSQLRTFIEGLDT